MEDGFARLDDNKSLSLRSGQKLILFRFPKDFHLDNLNGSSVHLSNQSSSVQELTTNTGTASRSYVLRKDPTTLFQGIRAIVRNTVDGTSCISEELCDSISVSEKLDIKRFVRAAADTSSGGSDDTHNNLPIRDAYGPVKQAEYILKLQKLQQRQRQPETLSPSQSMAAIATDKKSSSNKKLKSDRKRKASAGVHTEGTTIEETQQQKQKKKKKRDP